MENMVFPKKQRLLVKETSTGLPGLAFRCVPWDLNGSTSHQMSTILPICPPVGEFDWTENIGQDTIFIPYGALTHTKPVCLMNNSKT